MPSLKSRSSRLTPSSSPSNSNQLKKWLQGSSRSITPSSQVNDQKPAFASVSPAKTRAGSGSGDGQSICLRLLEAWGIDQCAAVGRAQRVAHDHPTVDRGPGDPQPWSPQASP